VFLGKDGWEGVDWIHLARDKTSGGEVNSVMNLRVP
jgi:hypothetical protein